MGALRLIANGGAIPFTGPRCLSKAAEVCTLWPFSSFACPISVRWINDGGGENEWGMWHSDHHTVRTTIHPTLIPSRDYHATMITDHEYPTEIHRYSGKTSSRSRRTTRSLHSYYVLPIASHKPHMRATRIAGTHAAASVDGGFIIDFLNQQFAYPTRYRLSPLTIFRQKCMYTRSHHHGQGARQSHNI